MNVIEAGSGTPLVLLHGFCGSHRYFEDIVPLLADEFRVVTPDLRGHGGSEATEGAYPMEALAEDVLRALDRSGIKKAYLLGHSLGGYVTLAFAERYSERLLGFGLLHSTSYPDGDAAKANRDKAVATIRQDGVAAFVDGLVPKLFAPEHRNEGDALLRKGLDIGYGTAPAGAIGCAIGMRDRPDRTHVLATTELPVLLLAGEKDEVIPPDRRFPATGPNISSVTLAGAGHMGMMERPAEFAEAIRSFVRGAGN